MNDRPTIHTIGEASLYRRARKNRERTRQNIEKLREAFESLKQEHFNWKIICDRAGLKPSTINAKSAYRDIKTEVMNHPNYRRYL